MSKIIFLSIDNTERGELKKHFHVGKRPPIGFFEGDGDWVKNIYLIEDAPSAQSVPVVEIRRANGQIQDLYFFRQPFTLAYEPRENDEK